MIAYAWGSGLIGFGRKLPEGALPVARGPAKKLRAAVSVCARHGYDGETLLVPGVPEVRSRNETRNRAVDALLAFNREVEKRLAAGSH